MRCVFVGGPADGMHKDIHGEFRPVYPISHYNQVWDPRRFDKKMMPDTMEVAVTQHLYTLRKLWMGKSQYFFYADQHMKDEDAVAKLISGYTGPVVDMDEAFRQETRR